MDKEADRRLEMEEQEFIERSTFDEVCGEAFVVNSENNQTNIFDDTTEYGKELGPQAKRDSIVVSVKKIPDFLPELSREYHVISICFYPLVVQQSDRRTKVSLWIQTRTTMDRAF